MSLRRRAARRPGPHSGPAQQEDDENGPKYAAADVHVNLRWFAELFFEARSGSASRDAAAHSSGAIGTPRR